MYADTADYEALNACVRQALQYLQSAACMARLPAKGRLVEKLNALSAYCDYRVQSLLQGERQLQQQQSSLDVRYWNFSHSAYFVKPGSGRVHRLGMLGTGIGGSVHISAVKAVFTSQLSIVTATLSARVGDLAVKGEAHASLLDKEGNFDPQLVAYAGISATLAQASLSLQSGSSLIGASAKASVSVGVAYAEAQAVLSKEEQTLKLKAGAAAVEGEVQCAFELFGAKITLTGSGSLGSAQAEMTYSHKNREWEFGSKLGFIAGAGFHVKVEY